MNSTATEQDKERNCNKETIDLITLGVQVVLVSSYVFFCVILFIVVV